MPTRYIQILEGKTERNISINRAKRSSDNGGWSNGDDDTKRVRGMDKNDVDTGEFYDFKGLKRNAGTKKWVAIKRAIYKELNDQFEFPVQEVIRRHRVRNDEILSNPNNSAFIDKALDDYVSDLNNKSLKHFYLTFSYIKKIIDPNTGLYINTRILGENHIFDRSRYDLDAYLNLEESTEILNKLLLFQFKNDEDAIKEFLNDLVDVIDKRIPKKNTLIICSPPSAGKNYFLDTIFNICSNVGYLGTANKTNNFAFQEAPNKRILVWNEVNYERGMEDMVKQLTGGDTCKVRVKTKQDTYVTRTPIICMVNQPIDLMTQPVFKERCVSYRWGHAPFLKDVMKYPYPLSFFNILLKYEIKF